jgi:hypothetical protein
MKSIRTSLILMFQDAKENGELLGADSVKNVQPQSFEKFWKDSCIYTKILNLIE